MLYCPWCLRMHNSELAVGIVVLLGDNVRVFYACVLGIFKKGSSWAVTIKLVIKKKKSGKLGLRCHICKVSMRSNAQIQ